MLLPAITGMVSTSKFKAANISLNVTSGFSLATEIADYLAKSGVPFSQAHEAAGACVRYCEEMDIELHQIPEEQLTKINPQLKADVLRLLNAQAAIDSRSSGMGTSPKSVVAAISTLNSDLKNMMKEISRIRDNFSGMISQ
jgi:argininosuccinate lyase